MYIFSILNFFPPIINLWQKKLFVKFHINIYISMNMSDQNIREPYNSKVTKLQW